MPEASNFNLKKRSQDKGGWLTRAGVSLARERLMPNNLYLRQFEAAVGSHIKANSHTG
jgi:hypothetical protein